MLCRNRIYIVRLQANMKTFDTLSRSEDDWAAITTSNQFAALGAFACTFKHKTDTWQEYRSKLRTRDARSIDIDYVKAQLMNAWSTERSLRMTKDQFSCARNGSVSQSAFPQAYYAAFNSTLASFACSGFTERSHTKVRKKVSDLACRSVLPQGLNVYVDGGPNNLQVFGLSADLTDFQSVRLNLDDINDVNAHLITFLKSTRKQQLEEKKSDHKIMTKDGKKRKVNYNAADWETVSSSLGKTSWLCLFYRKRIKSNYHNIGTFLSFHFDTDKVLNGLSEFVWVFNLANEINIVNHLGIEAIKSWAPSGFSAVEERIAFLSDLFSKHTENATYTQPHSEHTC